MPNSWFFIESKETHIINIVTIQHLCFSVMSVFARQSHAIILYSAHSVYIHIARVFYIYKYKKRIKKIFHNVCILDILVQK
jgi:hypothetical protein